MAIELFNNIKNNNNEYHNRIMFLTDCNTMDFNEYNLIELNKYSMKNIHCSFIGIGLLFDDIFIENIYKCKGCNCLSVFSEKEYINKLYNDFDLIITPIAFNVSVELIGKDNSCVIDYIYDTNIGHNCNNGQILTIFPMKSKQQQKCVMIQLRDKYENNNGIKYDNIEIEHRLKYEYEIEYEFKICNIKESVMLIEELMEYYTNKNEWIDDHHRLITFLNNNKIYNIFDLTDGKNINKIKNNFKINKNNKKMKKKKKNMYKKINMINLKYMI
eukprot:525964_1